MLNLRISGSLGIVLSLFFCCSAMAQSDRMAPHQVTGKVFIRQVQVAFIASGAAGEGRLAFHGRSYPFKVTGLGVGGVGLSKLTATGDVYDLRSLEDFEGIYGQVRLGWAIARRGGGYLWLTNPHGVTLRLRTKRQGLMLAGGADGVAIQLSR